MLHNKHITDHGSARMNQRGIRVNMVAIHPQKIEGDCVSGTALDLHTTSSTLIGKDEYGHDQYDTVRPEISELLYRLKYKGDQTCAAGIINAASTFLLSLPPGIDLIIPVPPSAVRKFQPVLTLATGIGAAINLPVVDCVTTTRTTTQLKEVTDPEKRKELVEGLYSVDPRHTAGCKILLFDDLFRSGTTLNAIAKVLLTQGQAASVCALTITKTRRNR